MNEKLIVPNAATTCTAYRATFTVRILSAATAHGWTESSHIQPEPIVSTVPRP